MYALMKRDLGMCECHLDVCQSGCSGFPVPCSLETIQLYPPLAFLVQHASGHLPPSVVDHLELHTQESFLLCLVLATPRETAV